MSETPVGVDLNVLMGELLVELINLNRHQQQPPQQQPPPVEAGNTKCNPATVERLNEADLRDYIDLTERIHQFELLTIYRFLTASNRRLFAIDQRNLLKIVVNDSRWTSLPADVLPSYVEFSDRLRFFELIVAYRWLQGAKRNEIQACTIASLRDFYNKLGALLGVEQDDACSPGCPTPEVCGGCRRVDGEPPHHRHP